MSHREILPNITFDRVSTWTPPKPDRPTPRRRTRVHGIGARCTVGALICGGIGAMVIAFAML